MDESELETRPHFRPGDVTDLYTWGVFQDRACRIDTEKGPHFIVKAGVYYIIVRPEENVVVTDSWQGLQYRYGNNAEVTVVLYVTVTMTDR